MYVSNILNIEGFLPVFQQEMVTHIESDKACILECLQDCSVNTYVTFVGDTSMDGSDRIFRCCGQPSANIKQRFPRNDVTQVDSSVPDGTSTQPTIPTIEIIAPTRSNSYVE